MIDAAACEAHYQTVFQEGMHMISMEEFLKRQQSEWTSRDGPTRRTSGARSSASYLRFIHDVKPGVLRPGRGHGLGDIRQPRRRPRTRKR